MGRARQRLESEAQIQDEAVGAAEQTATVITNQYRVGTVSYLNVITAQTTLLTDQQSAISILGNRLNQTVLLIEALGGGWKASDLASSF